jgi:hypothetical protein
MNLGLGLRCFEFRLLSLSDECKSEVEENPEGELANGRSYEFEWIMAGESFIVRSEWCIRLLIKSVFNRRLIPSEYIRLSVRGGRLLFVIVVMLESVLDRVVWVWI